VKIFQYLETGRDFDVLRYKVTVRELEDGKGRWLVDLNIFKIY